jgi:hypothetical protein
MRRWPAHNQKRLRGVRDYHRSYYTPHWVYLSLVCAVFQIYVAVPAYFLLQRRLSQIVHAVRRSIGLIIIRSPSDPCLICMYSSCLYQTPRQRMYSGLSRSSCNLNVPPYTTEFILPCSEVSHSPSRIVSSAFPQAMSAKTVQRRASGASHH